MGKKIFVIGIISLMIIPSLSSANPEIDNTHNPNHPSEINSDGKLQSAELNLDDVIVWTFNGGILDETAVDAAAYVNPQYCKRAWFRYSETPYNAFPDPAYSLWTIPPLLNERGALFEGGVQCAHIQQNIGWPCDNEYDEDHEPPYEVPDPVFDDFATLNADGNIYWLSNYEYYKCNAAIANENWRDFVLYWAYEQIDANVNALEFDQINAGYRFATNGTPEDNSNDGYDDYAIGTANLANRLSVVCGHGMIDPIDWFMPTATASSGVDSAKYAFDDDLGTYWRSETADSHWIEIDFGRTRTIQQIYLHLHPEYILDNFQIKYWNNASWTDFTHSISVTDNTLLNRSFLVEPVSTDKIGLFSSDSAIYLPELKILGQGFRQFLMKKYCADLGWTVNDSRWETEKFVDFADSNQCPDGTMNTFNYREYLKYHNWNGNPFGTTINETNFLDPENPFFFDWSPIQYYRVLLLHFFGVEDMVETIEGLYSESYSYHKIFSLFWEPIVSSVKNYAEQQGKEIYVAFNGCSYFPHHVDYLLRPMGDRDIFPVYSAPSLIDPEKTHLDGTQARINLWRMQKEYGLNHLGKEVPFVAFCDFANYMPFAHLGGINKHADERIAYLRTYAMEMYAAGINFCFPVIESQENAWEDKASDGTRVIDVIKELTDFLNEHKNVYRNVTRNDLEGKVTVNGIIPFNGEWNMVGNRIDSSVNESKVTISYMDSEDGTKSYLHIINHNWNDASRKMIPQRDVPVEIPVKDGCLNMKIVSPDFTGEISLNFQYENGTVKTIIPTLAYYDVIEITYGMNVNIEKPKEGYLYIADREIIPTFLDNTVIIGKITIEVDAYGEDEIDTVEFYIDDVLKDTDTELPYEWLWDERTFGRHEIKVIAYDNAGNSATAEITVWKFS